MNDASQTTSTGQPPSNDRPNRATDSYSRGIVFILIASFWFTIMAAAAKAAAAHDIPSPLIVLARSAFTGSVVAVYMVTRGISFRSRATLALHGRCFFGTLSLQLYFFALANAPLADTVVLANTQPLFIPFLAILFLGDRPRPFLYVPILLGFSGVVTLVGPTDAEWSPGLLAGVGIGAAGACAGVCLKKATASEHSMTIIFVFSMWTFVTSLPALIWYDMGIMDDAVIELLLVGISALGAQLFLTWAYARAPASLLSPLGYAGVLISYAIGFFVFEELPSSRAFLGGGLIVMACSFTSWKASSLVRVAGDSHERH
ncbi:MAG: DMT family transporter [Planctomycetes bacterium]|nr:DMT family transporter [Planctomycetota bacterium]